MSAAASCPEPLSYPDGFVVRDGPGILRAVRIAKAADTRALLSAPWMAALMREGAVPPTVEIAPPESLGKSDGSHLWLEHLPICTERRARPRARDGRSRHTARQLLQDRERDFVCLKTLLR